MLRKLPILIFIFLLLVGPVTFAQKISGRVMGVVTNSARQPLGKATVTLLLSADSSVERMELSDDKGRFTIGNLRPAAYQLVISEINHESLVKSFTISQGNPEAKLDTIQLPIRFNNMDMITIVRQKPPVLIKKDTIEFDAGSIKVRENDMVEELLKKLPGVEVGRDGTIMSQGEKVTQIMVDGKPFFGSDPKMATQNLPADIIDKIQLIDKKSEQAIVTKVEDGQVEKVINITIKKNRKKGYFGRGYLGYGSSSRYEGRISANHFYDTRKIAFIGGSNNTGRTDNSFGNNEEAVSYNTSNGINRELQSRASYSDKLGKNLDMNLNLGWNRSRNTTDQLRQRQTILQDTTNVYREESYSKRDRQGISAGLYLEYKPDTLTRIMLSRTGSFYKNTNHTESYFNSALTGNRKINEGARVNENSSNTPSHNGNLTVSRSLNKKGRAVFLNLNDNINNSLTDGLNISNNYFFPLNEPDYARLLNQSSAWDNRSTSINGSLSYNEPLGEKSSFTASYTRGYSKNNTLRETFDFNDLTHLYDLLNDTLSNRFNNYNFTSSAGLTYNLRFKKSNISIGATWQNNMTKSVAVTRDSIYKQSFSGLVPHFSYNYYTNGKRLSLSYNYATRPPQAYQLQSVIDNSNPLYLRLGNPDLHYSTTHRFSYNLHYFKQATGISINSSSNLNLTVNNISNSSSFNKTTGVQTTQPVNMSGVYNGYSRLYFSKSFKAFNNKNSWYLSMNMNFGRNANLLDGIRNTSRTLGGRINSGINLDVKDIADLTLGYSYSVQTARYSIRKEQNNRTNTYGLETRLRLTPDKYSEMSIEWNYDRNKGNARGFNRKVNMVNADVTRYMNKSKTWWLKIKVYDLLKQNVNVFRYNTETYIEDMQTNILTRYFLVSVNMKLNKFGGKK